MRSDEDQELPPLVEGEAVLDDEETEKAYSNDEMRRRIAEIEAKIDAEKGPPTTR